MNLGRGLAMSLLGAALGAGLWIGLYLLTDLNVRLLAIAIGGLAGFGMGLGNSGRGGAGAGLLAAVVAIFGVLGAQATVCHLAVTDELAEGLTFTEEEAKSALDGQVYEEFEADGTAMGDWDDDAEYPAAVLATAQHRWDAMSQTERAQFAVALSAELTQNAKSVAPILTGISFLVNFGLFGWVFLAFGASSAYKIGSTAMMNDASAEATMTTESPAPAGGSFFARLGPANSGQQPASSDDDLDQEPEQHSRAA